AARRIAHDFDFSDERVWQAVQGFVNQLNVGLREHGSIIEQLPSFIQEVPTGAEKGTYLAVDLGGTNIRVCSVTFQGDGTYTKFQRKTAIPLALMTAGSAQELFSWIASSVRRFLYEHFPEQMDAIPPNQPSITTVFDLGFTFSHAVQQTSIDSGKLIRWSKGFDIPGAVGLNMCALLQAALIENTVPVRVTALINDTVGTLLAQAYTSGQSTKTVLGAVFGTGTNGAYIEVASKMTKLQHSDEQNIMIVNTEWGNFDQKLEYLPNTTFDQMVDWESINPGFELFEKRISGMYLGEILRLVILALYNDHCIFSTGDISMSSNLYLRGSLESSLLSDLEGDFEPNLVRSRLRIKEWIGIPEVSLEEARAIRLIAKAIAQRAARLSAVALAAIIVQTKCLAGCEKSAQRIDIGLDGSLVELYPGFIAEIRSTLRAVPEIGEEGESHIDIVITKDGSGVGAALAAHIA
ncbi:hypothetical protein IQ07DRAFT_491696, partial [Pyrenochaeta sp. DS3sAY3a]